MLYPSRLCWFLLIISVVLSNYAKTGHAFTSIRPFYKPSTQKLILRNKLFTTPFRCRVGLIVKNSHKKEKSDVDEKAFATDDADSIDFDDFEERAQSITPLSYNEGGEVGDYSFEDCSSDSVDEELFSQDKSKHFDYAHLIDRHKETTAKKTQAGASGAQDDGNVMSSPTTTLPSSSGNHESKNQRRKVPVISIVGRPNVGKSKLANRISEEHHQGAIVHDEVGVTRDRSYMRTEWLGKVFDMVDTGGLVFEDDPDLLFMEEIKQQADIALRESCAVILVVDGQVGLHPQDLAIARYLRQQWVKKIPVYVAVNKCDSVQAAHENNHVFYKLGLGEPCSVSAIHRIGVADLLDLLLEHVPEVPLQVLEEEKLLGERGVKVAIVGRPNVGKSSLFNRMYGANRAIVSEISGTTRDTLDAEVVRDNKVYKFIDTAGVRKRGKVQHGAEYLMVNRALKAIRRSDVVLLVIDAIIGVTYQDRQLADRISAEGRACVVILNKWDAVREKDDRTYLKSIDYLRENLPSIRWARIILLSAKTGQRCSNIYDCIDEAVKNHRARVSTAALNLVVKEALEWQAPAQVHSKKSVPKIYYANQVTHSPPTVVFFVNKPSFFSQNYITYLERKIRESLHFDGTPLKFIWRGKKVRQLGQDDKRGGYSADEVVVRKGRIKGKK